MILFVVYAIFLLGLGLWDVLRAKGRPGTDAFFVNSRASGPWLVGISIVASCVGGSATLGMAGLAWQVGAPAFWWLGSGACGLLLLSVFLARKVRGSGARTMPEMADHWLGASKIGPFSPRRLVALIIVPAWLAILAAQFTAMGRLTASLAGLSFETALPLGAALIVGYSILGGQASVIRSDVPQFCILLAGLFTTLAWLIHENPAPFANFQFQMLNADFPAERLNYFLAVLGGSYVVCPMLFGRILSARDEKSAVLGTRAAIIGLIVSAVLITAIGLAARGLVSSASSPDQLLPAVLETMPDWAALPLMLALLSAILSSADSCLITASTVFCNDLLAYGEKYAALWCRGIALLLGVFGLLLAAGGHGILDLLLMANDIYVSGVVAPVFFAMLLPRRFSPPAPLSMTAVLIGGSLGLAGAITGRHEFVYAGLIFSGSIILASPLFAWGRLRICSRS